jgi:hypothetical protein
MLNLYSEVTKEATNRWKRDLKDSVQLTTRRNNEKKIVNHCTLITKEKLGIEHPTEGVDPLEAIKSLVEEVIYTCANNQLEIQHLR